MVIVDSIKLANGASMPLLGYGTWLANDPEALDRALRCALNVGYRLIDTAYVYGNEAVIGKVLSDYFASGKLKREEVFITTKLPYLAHSPEIIPEVVEKQLKDLQVDYVDLYLIHVACPCKRKESSSINNLEPVIENGLLVADLIDHVETWKALEKLYEAGKVKAIGLSNFNEKQIQHIIDNAKIPPQNLQVEAHIYFPQNELFEYCKRKNITFTAYGPLGSPGRKAFRPEGTWPEGNPLGDKVVLDLSKKYNKTPAQILLRHMVQRGISAIPKSTNPERVEENFNIFDFKLSPEDVLELDNIKTRTRLFVFDFVAHHPYYFIEEIDKSTLKKVNLVNF